jgi:TatD DNase family protein
MSGKRRREIPRFETPIIDTHCHLDYLEEEQLPAILKKAREVGVEQVITIAVSADKLGTVLQLTRQSPDIWGTQGIHPHEAGSYSDEVEARIRVHAADPRILAIGEIGLDYYYDHADRAVQRAAFERQLQLAAELALPVVIHSREADEDTRALLDNFSASLPRRGVIHSFTASLELAEYCLAQGFMLGFNGIVTFNRADNVRAAVAATPMEQLLLETDAPYLTPVPYRGRPNAPCYLPFIAERLAAIKSLGVETLLRQVYRNSRSLFFGAQ